ncbi:Na+/H+ antiporter NhaA [Williamsia soli]|uniref:Na+/H+ antiporter NhaA n=1 Tax=Williamsia soli TaxID=364929 RepID=UPI0027DBBCB3|nr:Na+/H+ antiporter NhaA [Williamsia soli]
MASDDRGPAANAVGSGLSIGPGPTTRLTSSRTSVSPRALQFLSKESGSAGLLLAATVLALAWANVPGTGYDSFWHTEVVLQIGSWSTALDFQHIVNDAAMAIFFLVVGLEISREVTVGELTDRRTVIVPVLGAIGGLVLPALIYLAFQPTGPAAAGWGIPISTDTAFLLGILALFGPRCPDQIRLFLLTLAIVDDIGAITVMAIFYTDDVSLPALGVVVVLIAVLVFMRWARMWTLRPYILVGIALWCAVFESGLHPTLAGVILGVIIPTAAVEPEQRERVRAYGRLAIQRADATRARLASAAVRATVPANERLQDSLHPVSALVVVPLFGLANAGVALNADALSAASSSSVTIGIIVALVVGNGVGISIAAGLALKFGLGYLPGQVRYGHLIGGAVLAGIGFTISLFITDLAFDDPVLQQDAKIGVLVGSAIAAILGSVLLRYLGERLPLCSLADADNPPSLPVGPWIDPTLR